MRRCWALMLRTGWVGGPADGSRVVAAQVDGDDLSADVDGDDAPGVDTAEGDLLPGDHDGAGAAGHPLGDDGCMRGLRGWASGAGAAQAAGLIPGQRAGPGPQQLPGLGIEEHQRSFLDPHTDLAAAEDLRGQDVTIGQVDGAVFADDPVHLDRRTRFSGRQVPGRGQLSEGCRAAEPGEVAS